MLLAALTTPEKEEVEIQEVTADLAAANDTSVHMTSFGRCLVKLNLKGTDLG